MSSWLRIETIHLFGGFGGCGYSHTGALLAASVSRAHVWAAVSDVEIIQSPGLLLVKGSLLEPAEPRGRRPEDDANENRAIKSSAFRSATHFYLVV